jgi:hypothetical protein
MDQDHGYLWPSVEQRLLLEAGLFDDRRAIDAFHAWRDRVRLEDDFSPATMRLLPLVYHNLHELGVSDPLMHRLKGVYRHSWYRTHRLLHAAEPVIAALAAADIPVLMTKGVPLAFTYYRNPALRPMADVDVVVPEVRLDAALGIMATLGWRGEWPDGDTRRFHHARQSFGPDGAELDLHWKAMYESPADAVHDTFFASAEALDFRGTSVLQPDPTHVLFMTVVHGVRWNEETPVRWIPDAITVLRVRRADIDWDRIVRLASSYGVVHRLQLGLSYLVESFRAPIPEGVLARLRSTRRSLFERFESRVLLSDDGTLHPSAIRTQMSAFAEYARHTPARNPVSFAWGYTHYLRYRLRLGGRRELLGRLLHGVRRRVRATGRAWASRAGDRT